MLLSSLLYRLLIFSCCIADNWLNIFESIRDFNSFLEYFIVASPFESILSLSMLTGSILSLLDFNHASLGYSPLKSKKDKSPLFLLYRA